MKHIIGIIILLITNSAFAQKSIHGTITDQYTQQPISNVSVQIVESGEGTNSDADGNYSLKNINNTNISLIFTSVGYREYAISVYMNNDTKEINIELQKEVLELDEVILATPFNKLQKDNVVKVASKNMASAEKQGIQNLMDGVSQISGVTQMSTGSGISKPVIRGLTGSRVLVFNQGVRLENFQFGDFHGIGINESGISSVEVIKGPASLLYGSDAVGGVLYLIPEKYAPNNKTKINIKSKHTSNTLGYNSTVGIKTSTDKFKYLARISLNSNADYSVSGGDRVTNSRYNDKDLKAGFGYKNEFLTTDIRYNYNIAQNGIPHAIGIQETTHVLSGKHQNLENQIISAKNDIQLKNSKIKTNIGYTWHKRKLLIEDVTKIGMQLNTLNYDLKWFAPKWKALESIIGVQGMNQTNTNFGTGLLLPDASINNIGVFTNFNYELEKITFRGGVRYDTRHIVTEDVNTVGHPKYREGFDKNLTSFTGALGLKSDILKNTVLRLNFSSGFRSPNLSELASKGIHSGRIEVGNKDLENEQNWQGDLALEYSNTHLELFANAFVNTIDKYIYLEPTGMVQGDYSIYQYQQQDAQLYGGEMGIHFHPHPWHWLHVKSSFETVIGKLDSETYLPLIPANQWKNQIRVMKKLKGKKLKNFYFNLGANHTFKAEKVNEFESTRDGYTLLNTSIGSQINLSKTKIGLNLSVQNLLDKDYISHLSVLREKGIANMGRNVIVGVNMWF